MRRILSHRGHQCSKESPCYRAFKAHTVTSSLVSPRVSSPCDLLLSLAPLRHLYAHICLPGQCRWLQGCESLLSPDCNILSLHLAVVCLDLSFQCQILLHHLSHRQQRGSLGGAAQALFLELICMCARPQDFMLQIACSLLVSTGISVSTKGHRQSQNWTFK